MAEQPANVQGGDDPLSTNTIIHKYLSSQGLPLTSENVSRALQANAQQPGIIPSPDARYPAEPMPIAMINDLPGANPASAPVARGGPTTGAPMVDLSKGPTNEALYNPTPQTAAMPDNPILAQFMRLLAPTPQPPQPNYQLELNRSRMPQLSGPEVPPRIAGPPEVPRIGAPSPIPQLPPPPANPALTGPTPAPQLPPQPPQAALPAPQAAKPPPVALPGDNTRAQQPIQPQNPQMQGGPASMSILRGLRGGIPGLIAMGMSLPQIMEMIGQDQASNVNAARGR